MTVELSRIGERRPPKYNIKVNGECIARGVTMEEAIEILERRNEIFKRAKKGDMD